MSKKTLSKKLLKGKDVKNPLPIPKLSDPTTSPYFSPRKTRNHIKIKYESEISKVDNGASASTSTSEIAKNENSNGKRKLFTPNHMVNFNSLEFIENNKILDAKLKMQDENLKKEKWEPENWETILENLKIMRSEKSAPVDTMGCDKCSDENSDEKTKRFHILVALMLSSQTRDEVTYGAMNRLKEKVLTPENVIAMKEEELQEILKPVSFYKNKTKYLKKTCEVLVEKYDSDIPNTLTDLINLFGVGPKMAHICMKSAWNIVTGIGVDVHVHRISNRLGWVRRPTDLPEQTRVELEKWLPNEHWGEVNYLMVGFGQTICTPLKPKCDQCLNTDICPFIKEASKSKKK